MFNNISEMLQKPTQDMKEMRTQARIDKYGSIHFKFVEMLKEDRNGLRLNGINLLAKKSILK